MKKKWNDEGGWFDRVTAPIGMILTVVGRLIVIAFVVWLAWTLVQTLFGSGDPETRYVPVPEV